MNLGLLQGLGRGLSQSADILSRGMAEDREVERQRMREASIEKRWQRQEQKDDARYADSLKFREDEVTRQKERDAVSDSRYADQKKAQDEDRTAQEKYRSEQLALEREKLGITTSERRRAEIEGTFEAVERKYQRELTKLDREYERKLDVARASGGDTEAIYKEYNTRVEALGKQELNDYLPLVKSYGSELKGTAVASYLELLDQKPANTETADPQTIQNALGDLTGGQESTGRSDFMSSARIGAAATTPKTIAPSPTLTTDATGAPELTFSNLMKKWNTPAPDSPVRPGLLTPEVMQKQQLFSDQLKQQNIQSAYGAALLQKQGR